MIIGREMAEICHGGAVRYGPIFGGCVEWPVFRRACAGQKKCNTCYLQYLWPVALPYEINVSPETGPNHHPVTLHTSIVVVV